MNPLPIPPATAAIARNQSAPSYFAMPEEALKPWQEFFDPHTLHLGKVFHHNRHTTRAQYDPNRGSAQMRLISGGNIRIRLIETDQDPLGVVCCTDIEVDCTQCSGDRNVIDDRCLHAAGLLWRMAEYHHWTDPAEVAPAIGSGSAITKTGSAIVRAEAASPPQPPGEPLPTTSRTEESQLANWLSGILKPPAANTGQKTPAKSTADQRLGFLVESRPGSFTAHPVMLKPTKQGGVAIAKKFRDIDEAVRSDHPGLMESDRAMLSQLSGLRQHSYDGGGYLDQLPRGTVTTFLTKLLQGWPVFLREVKHPLRLGEAKSVTMSWIDIPYLPGAPTWMDPDDLDEWMKSRKLKMEHRWRLSPRIDEGTDTTILLLDHPWYLADGTMGPVEIPATWPAGFFHHLMRMPPVEPAALVGVVHRLRQLCPDLPPLPEPALLATQLPAVVDEHDPQLADVTGLAVPRHCALTTYQPHPACSIEVLHCYAQYGAISAHLGGSGMIQLPKKRLLARDVAGEAALIQQLTSLGLLPLTEIENRGGALVQAFAWYRLDANTRQHGWIHREALTGLKPKDIRPLPSSITAVLAAAGWTVRGAAPAQSFTSETIDAGIDDQDDGWFRLHLGIKIGEERLDLTPIIARLMEQGPTALRGLPCVTQDGRTWVCLGLDDGRVVRVPLDLLQRLVDHLVALFDEPPGAGGWKADPWQALSLEGIDGLRPPTGPKLSELAKRLKDLADPGEVPIPAGLTAELRPYQREGLAWLQRLGQAGTGGCLADDMGLGKTVQAIAHLCAEHAAGRLAKPALVIGPASMVGTWKRELERFAPKLHALAHHGLNRDKDGTAFAKHQVVITTYATALRDGKMLAAREWSMVIADEAHSIANPMVKSGQLVRALKANQRIALTGTPLANHLGELHTLMHWLVPGLLGSAARFDRGFAKPIAGGDGARAALLRQRVAPFLLRRTKEHVARELPPRTESIITVQLEGDQRAKYESIRLAMDDRIRAVVQAKGLNRSHIEVFEALLRLRLCCCDPRLAKLPTPPMASAVDEGGKLALESAAQGSAALSADGGRAVAVVDDTAPKKKRGRQAKAAAPTPREPGDDPVAASAKLAWLKETLPELIEDGRRILCFSQFTSLLDLIEQDVLKPLKIRWLRLDGSTRDRDTPVRSFQAGDVPLFLLSLKAGGTGLTLTAADTVLLMDPWWNPAIEAQAADRAHRIGQDKPVFVYRVVAADTVEDRILQMQARKKALMNALLDADGQAVPKFDEADLQALLAPLPEG